MSRYGTPPSVAKRRVEERIEELRAEAELLEQKLELYGPETFIVSLEPQTSPGKADAEQWLCRLMERSTVIVVNGVSYRRRPDGAWVRAE